MMAKSKKEYPSAQLREYLTESPRQGSVVQPNVGKIGIAAAPNKGGDSMKKLLVKWDQDWHSMAGSKYVLPLSLAAFGSP